VASQNFLRQITKMLDLVYIYKPGCVLCDEMFPVISEIDKNMPDINVYSFDFFSEDEIVSKFKEDFDIKHTPFFIAMVDGEPRASRLGVCTTEDILRLFD
jgi:thiol-disulfide isomerase/thioredoxin